MSLCRSMEERWVYGGTTAAYMGGQEARATSGGVVASGSPWTRAGPIVAQQCPTGGQEDTPEVVVGNLLRGMVWRRAGPMGAQ